MPRTKISLLLLFLASSGTAQPLLYLPIDHWAYPYLDRFSGLNLIQLNLEVRPVTRREIVQTLHPLLKKIDRGEVVLSDVDQWYLDKLKVEFQKRTLHSSKKKSLIVPFWNFRMGIATSLWIPVSQESPFIRAMPIPPLPQVHIY